MSKSKEELNELKKRYEDLTEEIRELTEEKLKEVTGGVELHDFYFPVIEPDGNYTVIQQLVSERPAY